MECLLVFGKEPGSETLGDEPVGRADSQRDGAADLKGEVEVEGEEEATEETG